MRLREIHTHKTQQLLIEQPKKFQKNDNIIIKKERNMANQVKFITSHSARVKRAKEFLKRYPEKVSLIDREAFVEFFLLEDIERLYKFRLKNIVSAAEATGTLDGQLSSVAAERILSASLHLLRSAIEVSKNKILLGRYSEVWKAIPEGALMRAAGSTKYLEQMKAMLVDLLGQLSPESLRAMQVILKRNEELDAIKAHEANVQLVKGISVEEFESTVNPSVLEVSDVEKNNKNKPNPNIT